MEATDVYGLVPEDRVERLQRTLARRGLDHGQVEVHPVTPGRYELHDETLHTDASAARRGLLTGAAVGALVGLVVALLVPAISGAADTLGTVGALAGLLGLVGAMVGLQMVERNDSDPVGYREVTPDDHLTMVEVHDEHWHNRAHRIMERHGAVFVQEPSPQR